MIKKFLWKILSLSPLEKEDKDGFEEDFFFIKSPLTPLCQRGETRQRFCQREVIREGFAKEG